ncbi:GLPGLI family protein [Flavobacterium lindanitolerans]|jgi:GLPGLI family protein|uniref:GLPGLI family protein n=1 Tax=Flavobacterium lindanitolerans TaxID=428988 RepID=UPI002807A5D3|nr:GLPGLI family protein [Flavobacterium lindanitolerans]MDQ7959661.1 GLPGLI family protein [Flavobacterium lindanitolerans]
MRYIFIIIYLTFLNSNAQQSNNSTIKIQYAESISYIPSIINNYIGTLYVQNEFSHYQSDYRNTEKTQSKDEEDIVIVNSTEFKFSNEVFIDNKAKKLTENLYENKFLKKSFSVYEDLPKMKWTFLKDEKKINNFICKKAKTTFRGRTYLVWYTEKIPVSSGPWKFNGLPGLILSAEDDEGIYKWDVINIKYPYKGTDINLKNTYSKRFKYNKLSFKEYDEKLITAIKDKVKTVKARSSGRDGIRVGFEYSTFQDKEPINEWRSQMVFR